VKEKYLTEKEIDEIVSAINKALEDRETDDGILTQDEINEMLADTDQERIERKKAWIIGEIERMGILDTDIAALDLNLDAVVGVIKAVKRKEGNGK